MAFLLRLQVSHRTRFATPRAPDFLAGVLEHMLADENLLVEFANSAGIDPAEIARAHSVLGKVWERDLP